MTESRGMSLKEDRALKHLDGSTSRAMSGPSPAAAQMVHRSARPSKAS